ncbi:ecdysteroid-regulated 16 kDa protein-like [Anoplolepis gracilipes]|uniref:ecdysteroid-regulated 16 kDa protein-like n=1 Tax=Anoplolepis gracilipes TaxID=354296 RepID=UPI003B9F4841
MTRKAIAFSLLCTLCCIVPSLAFVYEDCGSEVGKFSEVTISSCPDLSEEKCSILRQTEISVSMKFTANVDISTIEARAFGVLVEVPIPVALEKPDVCKDPDSGITCPLKQGQEVQYKASFTLEKTTPALSLEIMWEFRNEKDEKIVCVKFPAKIK